MIIWSGYGIFVPILMVVVFLITNLLGEAAGAAGTITGPTGLVLAAVACWFVGKRLNNPTKDRVLLDETSGESVVVRRRHTLFWIEVQWWAIPCLGLAVAASLQ